jgi:hypothetical protein
VYLVVFLVRPRAGLLDVAGLQPRDDPVVDELTAPVRVEIAMANGNHCCSWSMPSVIHFAALLRIEQFSVEPVTRSVIVRVRANSPPAACAHLPGRAGSGSFGPVSIRRAVERPIPVVATTRPRIMLLSALDALWYWVRSLLVT